MSTGTASAFASTVRGADGEVHSVATATLTQTLLPTDGAAAGTAAGRASEDDCGDHSDGDDWGEAGEAQATVATTATPASHATRLPRIMPSAYTRDATPSRGVRPWLGPLA